MDKYLNREQVLIWIQFRDENIFRFLDRGYWDRCLHNPGWMDIVIHLEPYKTRYIILLMEYTFHIKAKVDTDFAILVEEHHKETKALLEESVSLPPKLQSVSRHLQEFSANRTDSSLHKEFFDKLAGNHPCHTWEQDKSSRSKDSPFYCLELINKVRDEAAKFDDPDKEFRSAIFDGSLKERTIKGDEDEYYSSYEVMEIWPPPGKMVLLKPTLTPRETGRLGGKAKGKRLASVDFQVIANRLHKEHPGWKWYKICKEGAKLVPSPCSESTFRKKAKNPMRKSG